MPVKNYKKTIIHNLNTVNMSCSIRKYLPDEHNCYTFTKEVSLEKTKYPVMWSTHFILHSPALSTKYQLAQSAKP